MQLTAIVTCKDRENIRACIGSIRACRPRPRTIVVDFGSTVPVEFPTDLSWVKIIRVTRNTEMFHKARAINIGIRAVSTKFLCITDADQIFQPNFFGVVYNTLQTVPTAFVMCKTHFISKLPENINFDTSGTLFMKLLDRAKSSGVSVHGDGCCNGVSTKWAMSVHGYDESYVGYRAQDSDFALRAVHGGLKKLWVENKTNMIHLPHPRVGKYYSKEYEVGNKQKYKKSAKIMDKTHVIVNKSGVWGQL